MPLNLAVTIFVGLAVLFANAYCPCTGGVQTRAEVSRTEVRQPSHPGCKGHGKAQPHESDGADHDHDGSKPFEDGDGHTCGHCLGTVTAASENTKSAKILPPALQQLFGVPPVALFVTPAPAIQQQHLATDLHPPNGPPTLLALGTLLLI